MHSAGGVILFSGQIEFIGGGWCVNDEAAAHYVAIIDQVKQCCPTNQWANFINTTCAAQDNVRLTHNLKKLLKRALK